MCSLISVFNRFIFHLMHDKSCKKSQQVVCIRNNVNRFPHTITLQQTTFERSWQNMNHSCNCKYKNSIELKTLRQNTSNFSFCHKAFLSCLLQRCQNRLYNGKGVRDHTFPKVKDDLSKQKKNIFKLTIFGYNLQLSYILFHKIYSLHVHQ